MPEEFKRYLWDSRIESIDMQKDKNYIIARVLEHGNFTDAKKILEIYSAEDITEAIVSSTEISPRTAFFFKNYFDIKQPIKCLTMQSTQQQRMLWPY